MLQRWPLRLRLWRRLDGGRAGRFRFRDGGRAGRCRFRRAQRRRDKAERGWAAVEAAALRGEDDVDQLLAWLRQESAFFVAEERARFSAL